jgi:hypothetical protein
MVKIDNMTPHSIKVLCADNYRFMDFEPSGEVWRLDEEEGESTTIFIDNRELEDKNLQVTKKVFVAAQPIPDWEPNHYYIVSALFKQLYPNRSDLLVPDTGKTAVRDGKGQIDYVVRFNY